MSNATNDGAGVTAQARAYLDAHLAMDDHGWTAEHELRLIDLLDAVDAVHAGLAAQLESARRANATLLVDLDRACAQRNRMAEELERVTAEAESLRKGGEASAVAARSFKDDAEMLRNALNEAYDFQGRLEACAEEREDVMLWGVDYVALPLDADGVTVHVGDVMDFSKNVRNLVVLGVGVVDTVGNEWGVFVSDGLDYTWYNPEFLRHHHAPTVEDVLTEFGIDWEHESDCEDRAALLKDYAAKLRLAEDGDAPC